MQSARGTWYFELYIRSCTPHRGDIATTKSDTILHTNGAFTSSRYPIVLADIVPQASTNGGLIADYVRLVLPCGVLDTALGTQLPVSGPEGSLRHLRHPGSRVIGHGNIRLGPTHARAPPSRLTGAHGLRAPLSRISGFEHVDVRVCPTTTIVKSYIAMLCLCECCQPPPAGFRSHQVIPLLLLLRGAR